MAADGIGGHRRRQREEEQESGSRHHINKRGDAGRKEPLPNSHARTGAGDFFFFPYVADHKQDWQPYTVDAQICLYAMINNSSKKPRGILILTRR